MISVLLTLLKICGIILLSLLGLILVLLLIVLFVPVRYRLKGSYDEKLVCHGKVTWLFRIVSVSFDYTEEFRMKIRLFGMDIFPILNRSKGNKSPSVAKGQTKEAKSHDTTEQTDDTKKPAKQPNGQTLIEKKPETEPKESSASQKKSLLDKIRDFIDNIKCKKEALQHYISLLKREEIRPALLLCKNRILKLILHLLPNKLKINAHIGMEDPALTGYILAFYSILPEKRKKQIQLRTEFDAVVMELDYSLKGAVYAFRLLFEILMIITDKNCRALYKLVKKEILNERN